MFHVITSLITFASCCGETFGQGDDLVQPTTIDSRGGTLDTTLTIEYADVAGPHYSIVNTRLLNGVLPGPTLRLNPGDTLRILFDNRLSLQSGAVNEGENEYRNPDHSNLHFHGGHVSGELPSDDIRMSVEPGESFQYETLFPTNHMPGTHWYHPHVHGSSSIQVGGGASGAMIVNDPNGFLPAQVRDAPDVLLFVQQISQRVLQRIAIEMRDEMLEVSVDRNADAIFRLVNGQYQPVVTMRPGEWQRWRIAYANWLPDKLDFHFEASSNCEMQLLAKDGVYIPDYPREVRSLPIPTAGRADVMVRCPDAGTFIVRDFEDDVLLTASVSGTRVTSRSLDPWSPDYPAYMTNLLDARPGDDCSCQTNIGRCDDDDDRFCLNGEPYDPEVYLHTIRFGSIVERDLRGLSGHPYHQHVYPFQIIDGVDRLTNADENVYYQVGDWHDVVMMETNGIVKTRYRADVHDGAVMIHCHILTHEDHGTMSQELIMDDGDCDCDARLVRPSTPTTSPTNSAPTTGPPPGDSNSITVEWTSQGRNGSYDPISLPLGGTVRFVRAAGDARNHNLYHVPTANDLANCATDNGQMLSNNSNEPSWTYEYVNDGSAEMVYFTCGNHCNMGNMRLTVTFQGEDGGGGGNNPPPTPSPTRDAASRPTRSPTGGGGGSGGGGGGALPNFVIIQPDDLPFYEAWSPPPPPPGDVDDDFPEAGLPGIEYLRTNGIELRQAYTTSSSCGTSRFSTMTGRYPTRSEVNRNINSGEDVAEVWIENVKLDDGDTTNMAAALSNSGKYRTGMVGKWHLSRFARNQEYSYSESADEVKRCGFDEARAVYHDNMGEPEDNGSWNHGYSHNMDWLTHEAVEFVEESDKPFFLYFNPTIPHAPDVAKALNLDCTDLLDPNFDLPDRDVMTERPGASCADYRRTIFERVSGDGCTNENTCSRRQKRELSAIWLDDSIARLTKALRDTNQLENTFILFQIDQGFLSKNTQWETGTRIASFVYYQPWGSGVIDLPTSVIDVAATVFELAGINPSYDIDGESWVPIMSNNAVTSAMTYWRDDRCLFFEFMKDRSVRCGCYKYMEANSVPSLETDGHSPANTNFFDLCDGTSFTYSTGKNMEVASENLSNSLPTLREKYVDVLECHAERVLPDNAPNYSKCLLAGVPTRTPTFPPPTRSPAASPPTNDDNDDPPSSSVTIVWRSQGRNGSYDPVSLPLGGSVRLVRDGDDRRMHSLYRLSTANDLENCATSNGQMLSASNNDAEWTYEYVNDGSVEVVYFACDSLCDSGNMKLSVSFQGGGGGGGGGGGNNPPPTPSPTRDNDDPPSPSPIRRPNRPTPAPTSPPTPLPTALRDRPTRSPTNGPTRDQSGPTGENEWTVESASVTFLATDGGPRMTVRHRVGSAAADVIVGLYEDDCTTPVTANDKGVSIVASETSLSSFDNVAKYDLQFDKNALSENGGGGLVSENSQTGDTEVKFCTILELLRAEDNMSMTFKKTRFALTLDMSAGFFVVSVNTYEQPIDIVEEVISMYDIDACMCQSSFACDDSSVVVEKGATVSICITPSSAGISVSNFDLSMTANGFTYSPVTVDDSTQQQTVDSTTYVTTGGTSGRTTRVTALLVTGLFQGPSNVVVINGNGVLRFDGRNARKEETSLKQFQVYVSTYDATPSCWTTFEEILGFFRLF